MDIDMKQLRELMRALRQFDLHELSIEKGDERIKLTRADGGAGSAPAAPLSIAPGPGAHSGAALGVPGPAAAPRADAKIEPAPDDASIAYVTSPFVGTFYASPGPDSPRFVDVGSTIRAGQVLCIVEAMKLMNEIEAEIAGTVLEVLAVNGKPVEYGDKLFKVKKS